AVGSWKFSDRVKRESTVSLVLEPLNPMPGSGSEECIIKSIAVRVNEVRLSVAVHIRRLESTATVILIRGAPDGRAAELAVVGFPEPVDLLPLLRNQRHEILRTVPIVVRNRRVDASRQRADH